MGFFIGHAYGKAILTGSASQNVFSMQESKHQRALAPAPKGGQHGTR
jgi:hypothetical protein